MKSDYFLINDQFTNYIKKKKIALYENYIKDKIKIYLDVKYWIILRDINQSSGNKEFLENILSLHNTGKYAFPISDVTYLEILKQSDKKTRSATIQLIDTLSDGITSVSYNERITTEVMTYFGSILPINLYKNEELVWTKLPFIFGTFLPPYKFINVETTNKINEKIIDFLWNTSLSEIDSKMSKDVFIHKDNTEYLNRKKIEHINDHKTFNSLYLAELSGGLDAHRDVIDKAFKDLFYYYTKDEKAYKECLNSNSDIVYAIYNLIRLEKITTEFPSIEIPAGLFSAVRWDKGKKHDKNDTIDFIHSSFALAYCDYFFTEKPLNSIIINGNLKYDKRYKCIVSSKFDDVKNIVNHLN